MFQVFVQLCVKRFYDEFIAKYRKVPKQCGTTVGMPELKVAQKQTQNNSFGSYYRLKIIPL